MPRAKNQPGIPAWKGDSLRIRRQFAGWTMRDLADRVGVSKTTLFRWEHNHHAPTSEEVKSLATVLDVPPLTFARDPRIV